MPGVGWDGMGLRREFKGEVGLGGGCVDNFLKSIIDRFLRET